MHVISAVLLLLISRFVCNVRHPRRLDTFHGRLLVKILESVLVEVDRLGPIARRRRLLELVVDTFEATTANLLRCE